MKINKGKKMDWKTLAEEFKGMVENTTPETAVRVEISKELNIDGIDIYPAETNKSNCFYMVEEIVDFCRCKGLSCWVDVNDGVVRACIH